MVGGGSFGKIIFIYMLVWLTYEEFDPARHLDFLLVPLALRLEVGGPVLLLCNIAV
jgi:hypothetical protein